MKQTILYSNHIHSFSRPVASKYGINAALVLGYIGFRISVSKNERDGKFWFYDTLDQIKQHYPYLGRSSVYKAIQRLTGKDGPLIVGHFNKRSRDRTNWYALKDEGTEALLKKKVLYFHVTDAGMYGVPAAVIINNLAYHINKQRQTNPHCRFQALSASQLAQILPFSRSTIQRALKTLVDEGALLFRTTTDTTKPTEYCFAHTSDLEGYLAGPESNSSVLEELVVNEEDRHIKPAQTRIQQMVGSKANKHGSKANEHGSKANDVTTLINPFENNPFEKVYLESDDAENTRVVKQNRNSPEAGSDIKNSTIISKKRLPYEQQISMTNPFVPLNSSISDMAGLVPNPPSSHSCSGLSATTGFAARFQGAHFPDHVFDNRLVPFPYKML